MAQWRESRLGVWRTGDRSHPCPKELQDLGQILSRSRWAKGKAHWQCDVPSCDSCSLEPVVELNWWSDLVTTVGLSRRGDPSHVQSLWEGDASLREGMKNRGLRNTHGQLTNEEEEGGDLWRLSDLSLQAPTQKYQRSGCHVMSKSTNQATSRMGALAYSCRMWRWRQSNSTLTGVSVEVRWGRAAWRPSLHGEAGG